MVFSPKWFSRTYFIDTRLSTHLKHTHLILDYKPDIAKELSAFIENQPMIYEALCWVRSCSQ